MFASEERQDHQRTLGAHVVVVVAALLASRHIAIGLIASDPVLMVRQRQDPCSRVGQVAQRMFHRGSPGPTMNRQPLFVLAEALLSSVVLSLPLEVRCSVVAEPAHHRTDRWPAVALPEVEEVGWSCQQGVVMRIARFVPSLALSSVAVRILAIAPSQTNKLDSPCRRRRPLRLRDQVCPRP